MLSYYADACSPECIQPSDRDFSACRHLLSGPKTGTQVDLHQIVTTLKDRLSAEPVRRARTKLALIIPACNSLSLNSCAVSLMEALSPKKPNAIQLLGKELVLWKNDEGQWVCMDDQCSHRLAPLSGLTHISHIRMNQTIPVHTSFNDSACPFQS